MSSQVQLIQESGTLPHRIILTGNASDVLTGAGLVVPASTLVASSVGNLDGGTPTTNYGGVDVIDAGDV